MLGNERDSREIYKTTERFMGDFREICMTWDFREKEESEFRERKESEGFMRGKIES